MGSLHPADRLAALEELEHPGEQLGGLLRVQLDDPGGEAAEQPQQLPGDIRGHEEKVVGVAVLQLEPVHLVQGHGDSAGVVNLVRQGDKEIPAGEGVAVSAH